MCPCLRLADADDQEAGVVANVGGGGGQDAGYVDVRVGGDGDRGELGEGVADGGGTALDVHVGIEELCAPGLLRG